MNMNIIVFLYTCIYTRSYHSPEDRQERETVGIYRLLGAGVAAARPEINQQTIIESAEKAVNEMCNIVFLVS